MLTFKQIQLVGFKSFADKTVIPLGEGVTCIVGPNGCGKSNVADAIRWVLGEQSAKMMRGSQMMDVIFGGTEKRRMMSFCEVTLTFDNTSRIFDIDCDEVEMTRRLYRDGTSEYILNREASRMKTLTGLLHGAGAAKEGYSIIGQGRIEQIMNAKPEDRRSIFEEATGIVVFKDRKADAERKLEAARNNLFVFIQKLQEVERILPTQKKAAENALKFRDLHERLRYEEMNLFINKNESAEGERNVLNSQNAAILQALQDLDSRASALLEEYQLCRDSIAKADADLQELNDRMRIYEVSIEHKSGETKLYTERARSVKDRLASAQEELGYSAKRIDEIDRELRRAEAVGGTNEERIAAMTSSAEALRAEISEINSKIAEYEYATGEHRKKVMAAFKDLSEMRQNMGSLSAQKELLAERLGEMEEDMEKIRARRDSARSEYEVCIQKTNSLSEFLGNEDSLLESAERAVSDAENKIQAIIKQIYDADAQIDSMNRQLEVYRGLRDRFDGYIDSVRRLMNNSKTDEELSSRIQGLIADVVSCDREYEVAVETAFGSAMQNVITRTRDDAQYLIEYLKNTRGGRVTFLPIEAMKPHYENDQIRSAVRDRGAIGFAIDLVRFDKKYENIIHNLLGNTLIVDTLQNAKLIATRYPRAFRIITLDGDVIATSGSMTGGFRKTDAGNLLANERRIKDLEEGIEIKRALLTRSGEKRKEAEEAKRAAESELNLLETRLQDARVELSRLTEKQSSLIQTQTSAESEYAAYGQSVRALKERLAGLDSEYSGVSMGASDLTAQSDEATEKMDDMSAQYEKMVASRNKSAEKLNTLLVDIASLESAVKAGGSVTERLKKEKEELTQKIAKINDSIPQIKSEIEELNLQAERTALTAEEQEVVNDLRSRIKSTAESKQKNNERIKEIDIERLDCAKQREEMQERQHAVEVAMVKIDSDLDNLRQRIAEEYEADYEECLKYKDEEYNPTGAATRINTLKRQLSTLGGYNEEVVAEYEASVARHEKMLVEKEDLEKAINDLTTALDDIRAEMLKIFNEGFEKISENFKRTFKELFGGGRAELQLDYTDCDDPLNAGIEIIACPPGKKLTKISLLSGGERALTAIAILFAIIGMRPMPFCVLDEIEAALDEANVARYAKYLKKFSEQTQFIVITHRKPTMENADILFGVTMEEKGVSKIVSVKLSEVESKLGGDTVQ